MEIFWTRHAKDKMRFYGLSAQRVRRVISRPSRIEEGIAENTVAMMIPASVKTRKGKKTWNQEIWVMIVKVKNKEPKIKNQVLNPKSPPSLKLRRTSKTLNSIRVISAWRYPGVSPKRNPIPEEILAELKNEIG